MASIHVLKFGGTSLRDASFINQAADIIAGRSPEARPVVVVSAVAGVTDQLLKGAKQLQSSSDESDDFIRQLEITHLDLLEKITKDSSLYRSELTALFANLRMVFDDAEERNGSRRAWLDHLLSFGERASVQLMEAALAARELPARRFEAQHFITTDATFGEANVLSKPTRRRIRKSLHNSHEVPVITGFIGSTREGTITTLGRSGSDYTASLIAGALCADLLEIWTDVDGVLTADPKIVPAAQTIEALSYDDIAELAAHGARVIHPKTINPLRDCSIPVQVRNSLKPAHPGTKISKTFSSNGHFRSVTVTGPVTHIEIPAPFYEPFYHWLKNHLSSGIRKIGIFRASAGEPVRVLIPDDLYQIIEPNLQAWLSDNNIEADIIERLFQVKKFTNALLQDDKTIATLLQTLADAGIQPLDWQRNPNRRHVSLLLHEQEARRAARLINDVINSQTEPVSLFIAGTGAVGGTLIGQLLDLDHKVFNFRIIGQCNSTTTQWNREQQPTNWSHILKKLKTHHSSDIIFVDATGSEEVARLYPQLFEAGIHIVTPSKLANTFEQTYYNRLRETAAEHNAQFRYETTVGAGLPVISTIDELQQTGDSIQEISGVVSGTMTYLFNGLEKGIPFSKAIKKARKEGYAEPDPRDDLSGEDVARKFLTLARQMGLKIEREELQVQSLIPEELASVEAETFLERISEFDDYWKNKIERARNNDAVLCYTGRLAGGQITIRVEEVPRNSPLGNLRGADNLIRIFTSRYRDTPLIIQGPGAGKDVTAAGVLADVIKVAREIT